jgi:hypothetical protein
LIRLFNLPLLHLRKDTEQIHLQIQMSTIPMQLPCLAFHSVVDRSTILFSPSEKKPIAGGDIGQLENMIICPTTQGRSQAPGYPGLGLGRGENLQA